MENKQLQQLIIDSLEELKARDITTLDVSNDTALFDTMIICSGTSNRHIKSIANNLTQKAKAASEQPLSVAGVAAGEWVLVDLNSIIVHIMLPEKRDFYQLEKLWSMLPNED